MIRKEENKFNVYIHKNPVTNNIFYVGIGVKGREKQKSKRSERWTNYVNKYGFTYDILFSKFNWTEACNKEKELISIFGRKDYNEGNLINMTNGGDGSGGHKGYWGGKKRGETPEHVKEKLRKNCGYWLGKKYSKERCEQMSKNWKMFTLTPELRKKISDRMKGNKYMVGKKQSQETINKRVEKLKGKKRSPEFCKMLSDRVISDETRKKIGAGNKGKIITEEQRIKISAGVKKYYADKKK